MNLDQPQGTPQPNVSDVDLSGRFWLAVVLVGAASGLAGGLLMRLLRVVQHACYHYQSGDFTRGVEQVSGTRRLTVMIFAGLLSGAVLLAMRRFGPRPGPGLTSAIWTNSGQVARVPTLVDALLSIVTVGMGVALGREGALKDAGGILGNVFCDTFGLTLVQRRVLVACGAGAGMAAAYNVPLGGSLFAAEVLLGSLTLSTILPAFAASFTAVAVSWLLLPDAPAYVAPQMQITRSLILWAILAGPLLGLISIVYVRAVGWAQRHKPKGWHLALAPLVAFALIGAASVKFPQLLGNGKAIVQLTFDDQIGPGLLLWLIFLRPLATVLCLRSGTPGGLFTPTMTLGALLGDGLGRVWNHFAAGQQIAAYALVGSGAFLAAATLGPLSSAVFLLELTRRADVLMVPLLIATAGATVTARHLEIRSIYSAHVAEASPRPAA